MKQREVEKARNISSKELYEENAESKCSNKHQRVQRIAIASNEFAR